MAVDVLCADAYAESEFAQRLNPCEIKPAFDKACCQLENRLGNSAASLCAISSSEARASIKQNRNVLFFAFRFLHEKFSRDAKSTIGCRRRGINRFGQHYGVIRD